MIAATFVVIAFGLMQTLGRGLPTSGTGDAFAASIDGNRVAAVAQQDNGNSSEDVASGDSGNSNANENTSADDNGNSNANDNDVADDNGNTNGNANDNSGDGSASGAPAIDDEALKQPLASITGVSNGGDELIATPGERVAVRVFPWLPSGIQLTIRPIDASTVPSAPGKAAGDLTFAVEARDASGTQLTTLPAEVNLAIRYADSTVDGLNEGNLTVSRLDPSTNQWQSAPKIVRETDSNYVAASITQLGTYTVSAP